MPYLVVCPSCGIKLKSAQSVPAGRSLNCPKCATVFTLSEPAQEFDAPSTMSTATSTPPVPPIPPKPVPPPAPISRPARVVEPDNIPVAELIDDDRPKPKRRRDEEEEDNRPKSKRHRDDDEEDDRPRSKVHRRAAANVDEDDDRPRSRNRRNDDEELDERPRSRNRRDEDDEDERPSRKKSRALAEDDDDEDVIGPRRRTGGSARSRKTLILALVGAAALLFLLCGGGALMYFVDPFGLFGGGASSDMLAWLPADTQSIEGIEFADVKAFPKALAVTRQDIRDAEAIGIKAEDVVRSMQGKSSRTGTAEVTVLKLRSAADKNKITAAAGGGSELTANGKKYFKNLSGRSIYFPSDRIVVLTRTESTMTGLLQKEDGKIVISKELQDAVKRADGHAWTVVVGNDANMFGGMGKGGLGAGSTPKSSVMTAKFAGNDVAIRIEQTFADSDSAKRAADQLEVSFRLFKSVMDMGGLAGKGPNPALQKMQDMKKMFDSAKISSSGSTVTVTMTGPIDGFDGFGKGGGL